MAKKSLMDHVANLRKTLPFLNVEKRSREIEQGAVQKVKDDYKAQGLEEPAIVSVSKEAVRKEIAREDENLKQTISIVLAVIEHEKEGEGGDAMF